MTISQQSISAIAHKYNMSNADADALRALVTDAGVSSERTVLSIEAQALEKAAAWIDEDCGYNEAMEEGDEDDARSCVRELSSDDLRDLAKKVMQSKSGAGQDFAREWHGGTPATVVPYTNWKGITQTRSFVPQFVWYGKTEWHPQDQWLIRGWDTQKSAMRDFALGSIGGNAGFNYTNIVNKGCEGWINLFFGGQIIAMIDNPAFAEQIKASGIPEKRKS